MERSSRRQETSDGFSTWDEAQKRAGDMGTVDEERTKGNLTARPENTTPLSVLSLPEIKPLSPGVVSAKEISDDMQNWTREQVIAYVAKLTPKRKPYTRDPKPIQKHV